MVALVIITMEYATTVVGSLELLVDECCIFAWKVKGVAISLLTLVDVDCREWALLLVRTTVCTARRRTLWCILLAEEVQRALGRDRLARLVNEPTQDVEVVARLGEDDRGRLLR